MFATKRSSVIMALAVLLGIAGLSYLLNGAAANRPPPRAWSNLPQMASSSSPSAIANGCTSARR